MHIRASMDQERQRGSTTLVGVWMCIAVLVGMAFAFDLTSALDKKSSLGEDLAAARDDTMSASFQLEAKNAEKTGREVADEAAAALRANGYAGEITVWFYEAPSSEVPRGKRAYAWGIGAKGYAPALYGALFSGPEGWEVTDTILAHAVPYSAGTAWRPTDSGNGRYVYAAGSTSPTYSRANSKDELPAQMKKELAAAIREAKQG